MQITIIRPLRDDAGYLESTWPHVSEAEGVRFQLQEEMDPGINQFERRYECSLAYRLIEQRRIVKGKFHPGRKILPTTAVTYELVYDLVIPPGKEMEDDVLFSQIRSCILDYGVRGSFKRGNVTTKEEE